DGPGDPPVRGARPAATGDPLERRLSPLRARCGRARTLDRLAQRDGLLAPRDGRAAALVVGGRGRPGRDGAAAGAVRPQAGGDPLGGRALPAARAGADGGTGVPRDLPRVRDPVREGERVRALRAGSRHVARARAGGGHHLGARSGATGRAGWPGASGWTGDGMSPDSELKTERTTMNDGEPKGASLTMITLTTVAAEK